VTATDTAANGCTIRLPTAISLASAFRCSGAEQGVQEPVARLSLMGSNELPTSGQLGGAATRQEAGCAKQNAAPFRWRECRLCPSLLGRSASVLHSH